MKPGCYYQKPTVSIKVKLIRPNEDRLRRPLAELAIVVAGVLIALAVNSAWETMQNRARVESELRLLLTTTRENEQRILQAAYEDSISYASAYKLGQSMLRERPTVDTLVRWLERSAWFSDFRVITGPYAALVESGTIRFVQSDSLRNRIVVYAGEIEAAAATLRQYDEQATRVFELAGSLPEALQLRTLPNPAAAINVDRFRGDPKSHDYAWRLRLASSFRLQLFRPMLAQTVALRKALETHLEAPAFVPAPVQVRPDLRPGVSLDSLRSSVR